MFLTNTRVLKDSDSDRSFFLIFGGQKSFLGATDTPVLDFW